MNEMRESSYPTQPECPGCGSLSFTISPDGKLTCDYCQAVQVPPDLACSRCGAVHEPDARYCLVCGADLTRECPACGVLNPLDARQCLECGQGLEILGSLFDRVTKKRGDWLNQAREEAPEIKAQQEATSQARLAEMWAVEERRREALAQARGERDRQQRVIVTVATVFVALVIIVILIAVVIEMLSTQSQYLYPY